MFAPSAVDNTGSGTPLSPDHYRGVATERVAVAPAVLS